MDPISSTSGVSGYFPTTPVSGTDAASAAQVTQASISTSTSLATSQNDTVNISTKSSKAAHYVQQARVLAPLDEATVKKLKAAIAEGKYPPPALVQGLVNLVGNNIAQG